MIYIIIGGSCCGKTSFCKNTWLRDSTFEVKKDLIFYTETNNVCLIGKYSNICGRERSGTDTISRSQLGLIYEQVDRLIRNGKDIVLEGDKAVSRNLFNSLLKLSDVKLILINSHYKKSIERNIRNSTTVKESTLKAICTKANNIFEEYKHLMNGEFIDTSSFCIDDFKNFSLYNYKDFIKKYNSENSQLKLFDL